MDRITVVDPFTLKKLKTLSFSSKKFLESALKKATACKKAYANSSHFDRIQWLKLAAQKMLAERETLANLLKSEAGKPITLAHIEVDRALAVIDFGIAELLKSTQQELLSLDLQSSNVKGFGIHKRVSKGVILGICPFNFPINLLIHKLVPAIVTGSPILIKPSLFTPLTALFLKNEIFNHLPEGAFEILLPKDSEMKALTLDPRIAHISFTGSDTVGFQIQNTVKNRSLTLELGGNAWCVVSDKIQAQSLPKIVEKIVQATFQFAGQSCISVQNIAVQKTHYQKFRKLFMEYLDSFPVGNTEDPLTLCGPMIHAKAVKKALTHLNGERLGKTILQKKLDIKHPHFFPLTLVEFPLLDKNMKTKNSALIQNELFAPIALLHSYDQLKAPLRALEESRFGLQSALFTQDLNEVNNFFENSPTGGVQINQTPSVRYDHQPYGGEKASGQGREGVAYAIQEYTVSKFLSLTLA